MTAATSDPLIRLEDVRHAFGDVSVLDGIDLTIEAGEFVALVGPNGAGKTTLLRTINGVLEPDGGSVMLDGKRCRDLSSKAISRAIATVPQNTHIGFSFTAEQIVEMGRTPHRSRLDWSDDSDPVERALERTEMLEMRDRPVDDLSGGERQRVLLARALAQESDALLLDEPTASLDINHQVQVLHLVEQLVADGKAAVAAIHDLDLAARYCDRLVLLADGKIRARGPPGAVLTDDSLESAFGATTTVTRNPATGKPTIAAFTAHPSVDGTVHVAGGGPDGLRALSALWRAGYDVSVGPIPEGDAVEGFAEQLDCETVTAPPFQEMDPQRQAEANLLAESADVLVYSTGAGAQSIREGTREVPEIQVAFEEQAGIDVARPVPARGDGGLGGKADEPAVDRIVESEGALLDAVQSCLRSK